MFTVMLRHQIIHQGDLSTLMQLHKVNPSDLHTLDAFPNGHKLQAPPKFNRKQHCNYALPVR